MSVTVGLLAALRRRRFLILTLFALLAVGAVAGAYLKRPSYAVQAKLLLNLGGRPISLSRAEVQAPGVAVQTVEALTTLSEIFLSRDLIEQLVDQLGPEAFESAPPANPLVRSVLDLTAAIEDWVTDTLIVMELVPPVSPRDALVSSIEERLSIYPVRQSQVMEVSFSWWNSSVPPLVLGHLLDIYLDRVNALNAQSAEQTVLNQQAEQARLALDGAQSRVRALRQGTGITDPAQERQALIERIDRLGPLMGNAESGESGVVIGGSDGPGAEIVALRRQLNQLRIERAGALAQFTADSPTVRAIDAQIAAAEAALARERGRIETALAVDKSRLEDVLNAEPRFADAYRDVELSAEAYRTYQQAANDRRVMRLADEELRIRVIDLPAAVAPPSGASRLAVLIAGLVAAAALACLVGLLVDRLRAGASEEEDEEHSAPAPHAARLVREADAAAMLRTSAVKR
jgi:uncharacterized protein involved in exopolysaccharide biosynthesis